MRDLKTLFGAAAVALVMTALPAAAQTGRIGGTVKDTNGQPIKGATVVDENPSSAPSSFTATTDDRGRYSMISLKAGSWKVTASAPGFQASSGNVPIKTIGAPMPPVDFTLAPGASGPAGALAGVNTKELQGELAKADAMVTAKDYAGAIGIYEGMVAKVPALTASPGAPELAVRVRALMPDTEPVADQPDRGLDHDAYVPLLVMYPQADVPVLQMSMPTLDPRQLFELGRRLRALRDEGVLVVGSGFLTHGLPFLRDWRPDAPPPGWSRDFDEWAREALERGDVDELMAFRDRAPGMPYAHPTIEHFSPLFVTLGAAADPEDTPGTAIDGFFMGLAKRSFQVG